MSIKNPHNRLIAAISLCVPLLLVQNANANRPYSGSLPNMPGLIEAENYDFDGQGDAYNDATVGNTGGAYRNENVDIEAAAGGGFNIGWFDPGEWVEYSVNVPTGGVYTLTSRVATTGSGTLHYEFYGATRVDSANVSFGSTGGWQSWVTTAGTSVTLNAGAHVIRVSQMGGGFNLNSFTVAQQGTAPSNLPTAYSGYTGVYSGYTLKYDDRFDSLNVNVWAKGDGAVGGESICRFQPQGVQTVNGNLELVIRNEFVAGSYSYDHKAEKGAYNYSCGELRTKPTKRMKYGRIETRMKAPARAVAKGYISSLFTYVHEGSPREWEEIDVELEGGRPDMFQANLIYGVNVADWSGTRSWGAWEHKIGIAPADQWRVYAIEWTPSAIKWFVDGTLVKTLDQNWIDCNPSCVAPQNTYTPIPDNLTELMMNFWIPNDGIQDVFGGNKAGNVYPMTTQYDWLRIYQLDTHPLTQW